MELVTHKTALTQTTDDNGDIGPLADGWQERGTARPLLRNGPAEIKRDPTRPGDSTPRCASKRNGNAEGILYSSDKTGSDTLFSLSK